jgi:SAM-dependent methyltransferase
MRGPREPDLSFSAGAFQTPAAPPASAPGAAPSPFDDPVLYDRIFDTLDFDVAFWTRLAREARGPVLDVGCGTGRITLPMLEAGADVDGFDLSRPMLARLQEKARARDFWPGLKCADMRDFTLPRRYALIAIPFNAFLHNLTTDDQLATLSRCREHLADGGALVMHVSCFSAQSILDSGGPPVLELERRDHATGHLLQHYDERTIDPVRQVQHSRNEARELDAAGRVVSSRFSETDVRWIYPAELDLLLRVAGFGRREIHGGFEREPVGANHGMLIAFARKE